MYTKNKRAILCAIFNIVVFESTLMGQAQFRPLGFFSSEVVSSAAYGISSDGMTVVGTAGELRPNGLVGGRAMIWRNGDAHPLPNLTNGWIPSVARAVSGDGGRVVGEAESPAFDVGTIPFDQTGSAIPEVIVTPVSNAGAWTATGIDREGVVIAGAGLPNNGFVLDDADSVRTLALLPGTLRSVGVGVSADGRYVVGRCLFDFPRPGLACRWNLLNDVVSLGDLPGGTQDSAASAATDDGEYVVGWSNSGNNSSTTEYEAFIWSSGTTQVRGLGDLEGGAFSSRALAVSNDGRVIGGWATDGYGRAAVLWDSQLRVRTLYSILTDLGLGASLEGWRLTSVTGISGDASSLCGVGTNPLGQQEAWVVSLDGPIICASDFSWDSRVNSHDFFEFIVAYFMVCEDPHCSADFNRDGNVNSQDFFEYLAAFLAGCP